MFYIWVIHFDYGGCFWTVYRVDDIVRTKLYESSPEFLDKIA